MTTFLKLSMHFMMSISHYWVMTFFLLFYCKRKNQLIVVQSVLLTLSLTVLLKTLGVDLASVNYALFNWRFPNYEIIMPIVFYSILLEKNKYLHLYVVLAVLMLLMFLNGQQSLLSLMSNTFFACAIVLFIKALEKTFTQFQCYIVFLLLSISIIPFKMGYYTYDGLYYFWLMALTYPLSIGVRHVIDNYVSSLLSRIS